MPFDPNNPPAKVSKLPAKKQRQWVHVFNSCYEKHGDDAKCHKMAWGAVKAGKTSCDEIAEHIDWGEMVEKMEARRDPDGIELRDRLEEAAIMLEHELGPIELLKVGASALNRMLVQKGLISEDEMRQFYLAEIESRNEAMAGEQLDLALKEIEAAERLCDAR